MSSDKNSHLEVVARLTKKHGVSNFVAVCPFEHDLAWSEDEKSFNEKVEESEAKALISNPKMTLLKTNLAFGKESHFIHFLTQCAIVGKAPYKNLVAKEANFHYAPIHTDDIAAAAGDALASGKGGKWNLNGSEKMTLRQIMNTLERQAGRNEGGTSGPMIPVFDYMWDFFTGTTSDVNMSRMVEFYENNPHLAAEHSANPWSTGATVSFSQYYKSKQLREEDFSHPTFGAYRCAHTD